jgi:DNA-directed RNA polymerase specialized sigma24 family protein
VHHDEQRLALERFVAERGNQLLRTAALLAGSRADGEDLLQSALERLLRHWRRIDGDPEKLRPGHRLGTTDEGISVKVRPGGIP